MSLTVVVCTYQRPEHLERCLCSLEAQSLPGLRVVSVVVEDDEPSRRVVAGRGIEALFQSRPGGVAEARNIGIRRANTDFVAFIDDDAQARPDWAEKLIAGFESDSVGAVGGPVIDTRSREQVVHEWWVDPFGVTHRASEHSPGAMLTATLNGCNMAFRRTALVEIGGFDPYYCYYYDETDVCARLARAGYETRFRTNAIVDHDFAEGPTRREFLYYSSKMRAYFSLKNFRDRVPKIRLLAAQVGLLREDLRAYRRQRAHYSGPTGTLRAWSETARGRWEGVLDGLAADPRPRGDVAT